MAAGFVAWDLHHAFPQGVDLADSEGPLGQRNLALEPHRASFQEQVAAGNQIQPKIERLRQEKQLQILRHKSCSETSHDTGETSRHIA